MFKLREAAIDSKTDALGSAKSIEVLATGEIDWLSESDAARDALADAELISTLVNDGMA